VHPSTLARWQKADAWLRQALHKLGKSSRRVRRLFRPRRQRPSAPWHQECPDCGAAVVVRTARFGARFWRCSHWPVCAWASWNPRHPEDCASCGSPRYWSRSPEKVECPCCGVASGGGEAGG
jgi:hypothetical protein